MWEYVNPFFADDERGRVNMVFRAYRYGPDFPGFENKEICSKRHAWLNHLYGGEIF